MTDYLSRQLGAGDTYHIIESSGFVAGSQDSVVQNNSFGFDPSDLKHFADLVMQFAPALGISAEQQTSLIHNREWAERLTPEDRRGLSPLFWTHINPYGRFYLDMDTRLDLTAA